MHTKTIAARSGRKLALILSAIALFGASGALQADSPVWSVDAGHTEVSFSIKHFFTPVKGAFRDFEIDLDYNAEDPQKSSVEARIQVASVDTANERRDNHLRSDDWFGTEKYPAITFKSASVRKAGKNKLIAKGPLTIKGETQEVELEIEILGTKAIPENMQQMFGGAKEVASFSAKTTVDRNDFEVGVGNWAATTVVGDEVKIEILLEAHRK